MSFIVFLSVLWLADARSMPHRRAAQNVYQAEDGSVLPPLFTVVEPFRTYVTSNETDCSVKDPSNRNEGGVVNIVLPPTPGYDGPCRIEALVHCPDSLSDSFWVRVDDAPFEPWYVGETQGWIWRTVTPEMLGTDSPGSGGTERCCFYLRSNEAIQLSFKLREPGASLDAVRLVVMGTPSFTVETSCPERGCDPAGGSELLVISDGLCGPAEVSDVEVQVDSTPCSNVTWSKDRNAIRCIIPSTQQTMGSVDVTVRLWGVVSVLADAILYGPLCLGGCSGHGTCLTDGYCHCLPGWTGSDCSTETHRMLAPALWGAIGTVLGVILLGLVALILRRLRPLVRAPSHGNIAVAFSEVDHPSAVRSRIGNGKLQEAFRLHNETMADRARAVGGYATIRPKDGRFLAVFANVRDAITWRLKSQTDIMENEDWPGTVCNWTDGGRGGGTRLTTRCAIHVTNDFVRRFDPGRFAWDYSGDGLEVARRLMQKARPGQNLITPKAFSETQETKFQWPNGGRASSQCSVTYASIDGNGPDDLESPAHVFEFFPAGVVESSTSDNAIGQFNIEDCWYSIVDTVKKTMGIGDPASRRVAMRLIENVLPLLPDCRFCGSANDLAELLRAQKRKWREIETPVSCGGETPDIP